MKLRPLMTMTLLLALAGPATAGPIEDATALFKAGDYAGAMNIVRPLAEAGDPQGEGFMGSFYFLGMGVDRDYATALEWYEKAIAGGDKRSLEAAAMLYFSGGNGIERDPAKAFDYWQRSGTINGKVGMGMLYLTGSGVPKDVDKAYALFLEGAAAGDSKAQQNLGMMNMTGLGRPQNDVEALKWYSLAADKGEAEAQRIVGIFHRYARGGLTANPEEALKWFLKAAKGGDRDAYNELGVMYAQGVGVPEDGAEAFKWISLAAGMNLPSAQKNLGQLYVYSTGPLRDVVEGYKWTLIAKANGNKAAAEALEKMTDMLTPGQKVLAQGLAENWQATHR